MFSLGVALGAHAVGQRHLRMERASVSLQIRVRSPVDTRCAVGLGARRGGRATRIEEAPMIWLPCPACGDDSTFPSGAAMRVRLCQHCAQPAGVARDPDRRRWVVAFRFDAAYKVVHVEAQPRRQRQVQVDKKRLVVESSLNPRLLPERRKERSMKIGRPQAHGASVVQITSRERRPDRVVLMSASCVNGSQSAP